MKNLRQWAVQIGALTNLLVAALPLVVAAPLHADQPWRQVVMPTVAEAAASFARPPAEYSAIHWAIWGGQQRKDRIIADIDRVHANGGGVYMINNSRGVKPAYLSPEYMDLVKTVVRQCKKNGMKVWIEGDCGYPDGFAGGLISKDYPQLGMQGIIPDAHCTVAAGQTLDIPLPADTLGILASLRGGAETRVRRRRRADRCRCLRRESSPIRCPVAAAGRSLSNCPVPKSATTLARRAIRDSGAPRHERYLPQRRRWTPAWQRRRGRTIAWRGRSRRTAGHGRAAAR